MEEIAIVLIQGFVEFFLEFLIWFGVDLQWTRDGGRLGFGRAAVFLVLGGLLGWAANHAHLKLLMPNDGLRLAALVVGPLAAAGLAYLVARWRAGRGANLIPFNHAATAFCFTLAFDAVRFAYGRA